jgi:ribose-phosphate pyrophosphokinase
MDLHSPQIQGFFKIPVDHLYATPVLADYFLSKQIPDLVVASPDVGFGKQANRFANLMKHAPVVYGNKTRQAHDERAEVLNVIGEVRGKNVLIVDDFTISGGTLIEMAVACKERGARDIYACVTHGVFSKGSAEKLARSPIKELVVTDTISYRFEPLAPCCKVISVAGLFSNAIQSIHRRESVSRLFDFERAEGATS